MDSPLAQYLNYYLRLSNPGFALLVTGPWGSGKTHQVKAHIEYTHQYYVSLYGLSNLSEMADAVYEIVNPAKATVRRFRHFLKGVSILGSGVELGELEIPSLRLLLKNLDSTKVFVFDDLERCLAPPEVVLGFINRFVEHFGCRVIVVADESRLHGNQDAGGQLQFKFVKEKVFGQTITIVPETESAIAAFVDEVADTNAREFLKFQAPNFVELFRKTGCRSLRVLRAAVLDLARLHDLADDNIRDKEFYTVETVQPYFVLKVLAASGVLQRSDIDDYVTGQHWANQIGIDRQGKDTRSPIDVYQEKTGLNLLRCAVDFSDLATMIFDGQFDSRIISNSLHQRRAAVSGLGRRPWQIVMNLDAEEDDVIKRASAELLSSIDEREELPKGELLHAFALLLMLARHEIITLSIQQVSEKCASYIHDLEKRGKFAEFQFGRLSHDDSSYGGYGYWTEENGSVQQTAFSNLYAKLVAASQQNKVQVAVDGARSLLKLMSDDPVKFYDRLCRWSDTPDCISETPFLHKIEVGDFLDAFFNSSPSKSREVYHAIKERSSKAGHFSEPEWQLEQEWWKQLAIQFKKEIEKKSPLQKFRFARAFPIN